MTAEQIELGEEGRPPTWPMYGVHLGLMVIIFSAIYTSQAMMRGIVPAREYVGCALVGLVLILVGLIRAIDITSAASRGLLALGGALALSLGSMPWLADLPGGGIFAEGAVGWLQPSVGHLGVVIAGLFFAVQYAVGRHTLPRRVPFRGSVVAAVLLLLVVGILMWGALRGVYDLSMTSGLPLLIFRTGTYGLLMFVCLTIPGVRGAGRVSHIYLGLALLGAVARNLLVT